MKNFLKKSFVGVAAMFLFAISANAQITTNVGVTALLADQMSVTKLTDVHFGGIFIPTDAAVVATMDYMGVVSITTGTTSLYSTNLQKQGVLSLHANKTTTFTVEYPATANLTSGNNTLIYTPLLYTKTGTLIPSSNSTKYNLDSDEVGDGSSFSRLINIAGTLAIPQDAYAGIYTGSIDVVVTWF